MANLTNAFSGEDEDVTITVKLPSADGEGEDEYQVMLPTTEQLILFASSVANPTNAAAAVMEILEDIFDPADYQSLRRRMRMRSSDPARLHFETVSEVIGEVMEAKADFPTKQSSGSSRSQNGTGTRSTGRVRSTAVTPRTSKPVGS